MKIDRQRFLSLVLGASPLVACGSATPAPVEPQPIARAPVGVAPIAECVDWSPSGACLAYGQVAVAPTSEVAPTAECYDWDDGGACISWEPGGESPVYECVQWDPTGECVDWS